MNPQGRLDVLIHRLSEELANRLHARTGIDVRASMKEVTEQAIVDMRIPRTSIDANDIVRSLFKVPNRRRVPKPRTGLRRAS